MPIPRYLAMTGGEMSGSSHLPPNPAWMACHFSPYGTGLSNLPQWLPPGSLLILNDRTPIHDHDPVLVGAQLEGCAAQLQCSGVLLDFQRRQERQTRELVAYLCRSLSCPLAVSLPYCDGEDCAVFLPPPPQDLPLPEYLSAAAGREIWLELALDTMTICLDAQGAVTDTLPGWEHPAEGFADSRLHCHYTIRQEAGQIYFTLWRAEEDLEALLEEGENLGVTAAVGLYQELKHWKIAEGPPLP